MARFGAGWLVVAALAVGLSWAVISEAINSGGFDRTVVGSDGASASRPSTSRRTVSRSPTSTRKSAAAQSSITSKPPSPTGTGVGASRATSTGAVRGYQVVGGQVLLEVSNHGARLISATPAAGFSVQTWEQDGWLRVDFSSSAHRSSVFATWNGHPASVQTVEY